MELNEDLIEKILKTLVDKGDPFYPVSHLAKDIGENCSNPSHDHDPNGIAGLTDKIVSHLLHLQDMKCITNVNGSSEWGYMPGGNACDFKTEILKDEWNFPHCYNGGGADSIIRINANGRQLLTVLEDTTLQVKEKKRALISKESLTYLFARLAGELIITGGAG